MIYLPLISANYLFSQRSPRPPLPPELIVAIVDHLTDDKDALRSCSLVAQSFLSPSRRHLFRNLVIHLSPRFQISNRRLDELHLRPSYHFSLIRSLSIVALDTKFPAVYQPLLNAVRSLPNLTRVEIKHLWNSQHHTESEGGGVGIADVLDECFRPTTTHLSLIKCHTFPSDHLYRCISLTHLSIDDCEFLPPQHEIAPASRIRLKSLLLNRVYLPLEGDTIPVLLFLQHPWCPWDISHLRAFAVRLMSPVVYHAVLSFIQELPKDLTSLAVEIPPAVTPSIIYNEWLWTSTQPLINFSKMPRLTCLTLKISVHAPVEFNRLPWVVDQLSQFPVDGQLTEFHLWISFYERVTLDSIRSLRWPALDDRLTEERFMKLKRVYIKAYYTFTGWFEMDEVIERLLKDALPKTRGQKNLYVEASTVKWESLDENFPAL